MNETKTKTAPRNSKRQNKAVPPAAAAPEAPIMPGLQQQVMVEIGRIAEYGELVRVADLAARMEAYRPGCAFAEALEALEKRGNLEVAGEWTRVRMEGAEPMADVVAIREAVAGAPDGVASQEATSTLVADPSDLAVELAKDLHSELHVLVVCHERCEGDVPLMHDEIGRMLRVLDRKAQLLAEIIGGVVAW